MQKLAGVIFFKMAMTVGWVVSLLLFSSGLQVQVQVGLPPTGEQTVFIRLLGMAYAALLLGYAFGFFAIREGIYPRGVVWTGIVSNGGACLLLGIFRSTWGGWRGYAPTLMWSSFVATGLITAGLIAFGPCDRFATAASK